MNNFYENSLSRTENFLTRPSTRKSGGGGAPVSDPAFLVRARSKAPCWRPALRWQCQDAPTPKSSLQSALTTGNFSAASGRSVAWLARVFRVHEVVSSNLTAPTIFLLGRSPVGKSCNCADRSGVFTLWNSEQHPYSPFCNETNFSHNDYENEQDLYRLDRAVRPAFGGVHPGGARC